MKGCACPEVTIKQISKFIPGYKYQVKYILKNGNIALMSRRSEYSNTFFLQYRLKVSFFANVNFFKKILHNGKQLSPLNSRP